MPFTLPQLPYAYNALEPHFDAATMEIHHTKHHQTYITNLNNALANTPHEGNTIEELMATISTLPMPVRNNGGGHFNHSLFWEQLTPTSTTPSAALQTAIDAQFGSMQAFKDAFAQAALTRFGSGWAWLCIKADKSLCVCSSPNQDNPTMDLAECKGTPIIGIDVWEHAYYLHYQNRRADFIAAFWNVLNWETVSQRYAQAIQ